MGNEVWGETRGTREIWGTRGTRKIWEIWEIWEIFYFWGAIFFCLCVRIWSVNRICPEAVP